MKDAKFLGAKLAILVGEKIVTILRDDVPYIPWPGHWDLPGGASEAGETPEDCVLRELKEELDLTLSASDLIWSVKSPRKHSFVWFFVAEWPDFDARMVKFGDEGERWALKSINWFLNDPMVVPQHQERLKTYINQR